MTQETPKNPVQQPVNGGSWLTYVVVIFVLIFVLGLVFAPLARVGVGINQAPEKRAEALAAQVKTACSAYFKEYGKLPPTSENYRLIKILTNENPRGVTFLNLKPTDMTPNGDLIDPWGTPYRITFDAGTNIIVNSAGPDKVFGTPDDITNK